MIEIRNLQKLYDDTLAVNGVSVTIPTGVVCGLVGPNGAGKTTTLRCLAGLIRPTAGEIHVDGINPVTDEVRLKQNVAYVPDDPPLFDDLTVGQHLDFVAQLYRIRDHRPAAFDLLDRFDLMPKYDARVTALSRGMRQKLAIACAYLISPPLLLLDEPLTGLDPPGIRVLLDSITQYARAGRTVIISSHLLAMIGDVCDQVWMMNRGSVRFHGTTQCLRKSYPAAATLEQAFFAAMNDDPAVASETTPTRIAEPELAAVG
ncbi:ABC transporter ATP-binding protein [Neorhodopirellula pilleata]|uniref:ABC-type transporter ATP-binding protein EcsA n=1 Tax=Neorhodopirellula pilleata TaxID=2714738 RepID=A0A5C5ZGW6_9BACT|nr:ABC transporter ATP-binding protein [Neorhodopirellula pilleata]TWT86466.1 ABC-type transporter ATP-binding protein EcsA [Neorhodopirellula pilleata]